MVQHPSDTEPDYQQTLIEFIPELCHKFFESNPFKENSIDLEKTSEKLLKLGIVISKLLENTQWNLIRYADHIKTLEKDEFDDKRRKKP